jgi:hypothetical protein
MVERATEGKGIRVSSVDAEEAKGVKDWRREELDAQCSPIFFQFKP